MVLNKNTVSIWVNIPTATGFSFFFFSSPLEGVINSSRVTAPFIFRLEKPRKKEEARRMCGIQTLFCLLMSGHQNTGKQRVAVKSSTGRSHGPRCAKLLAPPPKKQQPPLKELLSHFLRCFWGWHLPREGSWAPHRAAILFWPKERAKGWEAPGKHPLLCSNAVLWAGGRPAAIPGCRTAGYRSPNQQVFLLFHRKMQLSAAVREASEGSPALGRLSKPVGRLHTHELIWRIKN